MQTSTKSSPGETSRNASPGRVFRKLSPEDRGDASYVDLVSYFNQCLIDMFLDVSEHFHLLGVGGSTGA